MKERKRGRPLNDRTPSRDVLVRLYVKEGRSVRDVAEAVGCPRTTILDALKRHDIPVRSRAKRSRLRDINPALIRADIATKGVSATAKALNVDRATLRHYIRKASDG